MVHADLATAAPFPSHNGIVARAAERLVWVARGVDERSVLVPEAGHLALRAAYESNLRGYRDGGTGRRARLAAVRRRGGRQGSRGESRWRGVRALPRPVLRLTSESERQRASEEARRPRMRALGQVELRVAAMAEHATAPVFIEGECRPLTRKTDGYQACTLNCCLGRIPVASALTKGGLPRGYPVRVLVFSCYFLCSTPVR